MDLLTAVDIKHNQSNDLRLQKLQDIASGIKHHLKCLNEGFDNAVSHADKVDALLADAKKLCDAEGFEAFKRRYCQSLGKSRAYELLSIKEGRKNSRRSP